MTLTMPDSTQADEAPTVTLASIIRELDAEYPQYSDRELTTLVVEELAGLDDSLAATWPALVEYARVVRRNRVRTIERRAAAEWNPIDPLKGRKEAMADFRKWASELTNCNITVGGKRLRAGEMTVADWQQRVAELTAGIESDVASRAHAELVVERLTTARRSTLDAYLAR